MSVTSEDESEERCGSYSLSADISESEFSNSGSSCRRYKVEEENGSASSSGALSPISAVASSGIPAPVVRPFMFALIGGKDAVVWDKKPQKCDADLSGFYLV